MIEAGSGATIEPTVPEESVGVAAPTGDARHAAYLATRTFASLDGVRGLCALAVIWHHAPAVADGPRIFGRGFLGVDMFFALSGFLIVTLLLRERDRRGSIHLGDFYIRRSLRIFPIYYGLIGLVLLTYLVSGRDDSSTRGFYESLPYLLTYTLNWVRVPSGNFFVAWSLAAEEQFYLVWPAVETFLSKARAWAILAIALGINQAINFGLLDGLFLRIYGEARPLEILQVTFTPILLGVLVAHLLHDPVGYRRATWLLGHRITPMILATALVLMLQFAPEDLQGLPRLAIHLLMASALISLVVREDHFARPWLTIPILAHLGTISYGLYLYHQWAIHGARIVLARMSIANEPLFFLATLAGSVAIAEVSYRVIERPLNALKARYRR